MGIFFWLGGVYALGNDYSTMQVTNIWAHRLILGFVISISALRMNWAMHGVIQGVVIGSVFCLYEAIYGYPMWIVWALILVNAIYGLLIEYLTSKVFKAPAFNPVAA